MIAAYHPEREVVHPIPQWKSVFPKRPVMVRESDSDTIVRGGFLDSNPSYGN
jgi:hypothetical protein